MNYNLEEEINGYIDGFISCMEMIYGGMTGNEITWVAAIERILSEIEIEERIRYA